MSVLRGVLVAAAFMTMSCGTTVQVTKSGEPVALPSGEPRTSCERAQWVSLVPTRVSASVVQGTPSSQGSQTIRSPSGRIISYVPGSATSRGGAGSLGLGVFYWGKDDIILVEEMLPEMGEPVLEQRHLELVGPVQTRETTSKIWLASSMTLAFGGTAAAILGLVYPDPPREPDDFSAFDTGSIILLSGLGATILGGLALVGYLMTRPSPGELARLNVRQRVFLPNEHDTEAVHRGIARYNGRIRRQCQDK